jgi:hypothetical protein
VKLSEPRPRAAEVIKKELEALGAIAWKSEVSGEVAAARARLEGELRYYSAWVGDGKEGEKK